MLLHEDLLEYYSTYDVGLHYDINNDNAPKNLRVLINTIIRERILINKYTYGFTTALTIDNIHKRREIEYVALSLNDTYKNEKYNFSKYCWPKQAIIETFRLPSKLLSFIFPKISEDNSFISFLIWVFSFLISLFKPEIKDFIISLF